jgi:hypothetical protein
MRYRMTDGGGRRGGRLWTADSGSRGTACDLDDATRSPPAPRTQPKLTFPRHSWFPPHWPHRTQAHLPGGVAIQPGHGEGKGGQHEGVVDVQVGGAPLIGLLIHPNLVRERPGGGWGWRGTRAPADPPPPPPAPHTHTHTHTHTHHHHPHPHPHTSRCDTSSSLRAARMSRSSCRSRHAAASLSSLSESEAPPPASRGSAKGSRWYAMPALFCFFLPGAEEGGVR